MKQIDGFDNMSGKNHAFLNMSTPEADNNLSEQLIDDTSDLPTSLIITNIDNQVFNTSDLRVSLI
jgi:hypothetical protein